MNEKKLNTALTKTPKANKGIRQRIGKKLAKVREELNALPIRCNKYQVIVKGKGHAYRFFNWCLNEEDHGNEWLPAKETGMAWQPGETPKAKDSLYFHKLYDVIARRKFWRRLRCIPEWLGWCDREWHHNKHHYEMDAQQHQKQLNDHQDTLNSYYNQPIGAY